MSTPFEKKRQTSENVEFEAPNVENEFQLKEIFKEPTENALDSDINNPWNFRSWWNTIQAQDSADYIARSKLYYKALQYLPGSYKLWYNFLKETRKNAKSYPISDPRYSIANDLHENALQFMSKMPIIWLKYAKFLSRQKLMTKTRHIFDNALKSLPATQHEIIWTEYVKWAKSTNCFELTKHVLLRYVGFNPDSREEYIDFLLENEKFYEAALELIKVFL